MDNINYRFLNETDIIKYQMEIEQLMNMILNENITQRFPDNLSKKYVSQLPKFISDGSALIVGAFDGENIIGFQWCYYIQVFNEKRIHSNFIGVNSNYQNCGIAHHMLKLIEEKAKEKGVYIIEAMVTLNNTNSFNYHKNQGFIVERCKMKKVIE